MRSASLDAGGNEVIAANVPEHSHAGIQCWWAGDSIARYFVSDARRMLDYLAARPEVDPARIGAAGNSGGGTLTCWLTLVEPRLAAAVPSCFITAREHYQRSGQAQDPEQIIPGGALHGLDHEDFLIAMALLDGDTAQGDDRATARDGLVDLLFVYLLRTWFAEYHDAAGWGRALLTPHRPTVH